MLQAHVHADPSIGYAWKCSRRPHCRLSSAVNSEQELGAHFDFELRLSILHLIYTGSPANLPMLPGYTMYSFCLAASTAVLLVIGASAGHVWPKPLNQVRSLAKKNCVAGLSTWIARAHALFGCYIPTRGVHHWPWRQSGREAKCCKLQTPPLKAARLLKRVRSLLCRAAVTTFCFWTQTSSPSQREDMIAAFCRMRSSGAPVGL